MSSVLKTNFNLSPKQNKQKPKQNNKFNFSVLKQTISGRVKNNKNSNQIKSQFNVHTSKN